MVFTSHLLPGCLVYETGISCRAMKPVDEHMFVVRYGAKVSVGHQTTVKFSKALALTWRPVFQHILMETLTQVRRKFLLMEGKQENGKKGCRKKAKEVGHGFPEPQLFHVAAHTISQNSCVNSSGL